MLAQRGFDGLVGGAAQGEVGGLIGRAKEIVDLADQVGDALFLRGKPILVVNTASLCGYTPQYAGLQQLWTRFHERGLMIIGVPSNDFGGQEPGGADDILHTAHGQYGIGFPLAAKAQVKGPNPHPFYKWAASERPLETPRWNFHKYLVGRDGHIAAVFATDIEPMDARVIDAIVKQLPSAE